MSADAMNEEGPKPAFEVLSVETNPPARSASRLPVALALLLALAAIAAGGWHWYALRELRAGLVGVQAGVSGLEAQLERGPDARLTEALRGMEQGAARITGLDARVSALDEATAALQRRLAEIDGADRRDWALAEAEYLERLAAQSLLMGREVRGALALLGAADAILHELDDPALHGARAALAQDMAALRAVAQFDVEGIYLRLSALVGQVPALALMERSVVAATAGTGSTDVVPEDWWARAKAVLGRYVVVRHRNESIKPLLPLAEEGYLRMNLRMGLEQAKLALLAAEPAVYRSALAQVRGFAADYLGVNDAASRAFLAEVDALAAVDVAPALPDISGSLRALRDRPGAPLPAQAAAGTAAAAHEPGAGGQ
jgi:uroporphyrin-III C-methyltransferase